MAFAGGVQIPSAIIEALEAVNGVSPVYWTHGYSESLFPLFYTLLLLPLFGGRWTCQRDSPFYLHPIGYWLLDSPIYDCDLTTTTIISLSFTLLLFPGFVWDS